MGLDVLSHFNPLVQAGAASAPLADVGLLFVFLMAAGVTAMASVGFAVWLTYHVVRLCVVLIARLLLLPIGGGTKRRTAGAMLPPAPSWLACPDPVCRAVNPQHARFCRQCGRMVGRARVG